MIARRLSRYPPIFTNRKFNTKEMMCEQKFLPKAAKSNRVPKNPSILQQLTES